MHALPHSSVQSNTQQKQHKQHKINRSFNPLHFITLLLTLTIVAWTFHTISLWRNSTSNRQWWCTSPLNPLTSSITVSSTLLKRWTAAIWYLFGTYTSRTLKRTVKIVTDPSHSGLNFFQTLTSGSSSQKQFLPICNWTHKRFTILRMHISMDTNST